MNVFKVTIPKVKPDGTIVSVIITVKIQGGLQRLLGEDDGGA